MTPQEVDALVVDYVAHAGILGCDEDEAVMSIADTDEDDLVEDEVQEAVDRLALSGALTREGCHGIALPLTEWSDRLAKAAGNPGAAPAILALLKGAS